ncbi:MAG: DUF1254 domain-containing protein [Cellvibrionaceae bacterium]
MKKLSLLAAVMLVASLGFYSVNIIKKTADAYLFAYPLVLMDATRNSMAELKPGASHANHLSHLRDLPTHEFRAVVRPNNDTLYSIAWFDLSEEPQIISTPEMGDNYYVLPFMDAWTNVFSNIGTRTTGNRAQQFALVGPDWKGELPKHLQRIDSPTNMVWMIGRIEVKDLSDPQPVYQLQDQFRLAGLEDSNKKQWRDNSPESATAAQNTDALSPPERVNQLRSQPFFLQFSELLEKQYASDDDQLAIDNLNDLGIVAGQPFEPNRLQNWLMNFAIDKAREKLSEIATQRQPNENNWFVIREGIGRYGQDYKSRAFVALYGLGALPPEEASYPNTRHDSSYQTLSGQYKYRIEWDRDQLPPVGAFWSLTIYDDEGYMVENPINRYRIGSNNQLNWNADGSLQLQLQNTSPDSAKSNWLPVPEGSFNIVLRMYWPQQSFLDGDWQLPHIERMP